MSVTIRPSTESPRNSRRSFVTSRACSNANDRWVSAASRRPRSQKATPSAPSSANARWVSAASRRPGSRKATPSAASSAPPGTASGDPTWLLDLDRLSAGVVAAVGADAVRPRGLLALRTGAVGARRRLPRRTALRGAGLALLLLGDSHRRFLLGRLSTVGRRYPAVRAADRKARRSAG